MATFARELNVGILREMRRLTARRRGPMTRFAPSRLCWTTLVGCVWLFGATPAAPEEAPEAFHRFFRPHLGTPLEVSAEGNALVSTSSVPDFRGTPIIFRLDVSP
jgi:hypothetical protein